jgi:hypothetical protein
MTRPTARVARARRWLQRWWLTIGSLAAAGGVAAMPVNNAWVVSAFALIAAGWGYFVRSMQSRSLLHQKVDRVTEIAVEVLDEVRADRQPLSGQRPELYVVPHD